MRLIVNAQPNSQATSPQCLASPSRAKPVIGKFTFECFQFSDVDSPLVYQFGFNVPEISNVSAFESEP